MQRFFCTLYNITYWTAEKETLSSNELRSSSKKIGQLCPITVDYYGRIIDGVRRSHLNDNWPVMRLEHIKTDKERLIARIVSNVVRRTVSQKEKGELLGKLGQTYLEEGIEPGRISYKISEETGMSYRWVAKYLPIRFKNGLQSNRASMAAHCATTIPRMENEFLRPPKRKGALSIRNYLNTEFVSLTLEKKFYEEFDRDSQELGVPTEFSILKALEDYHEKMKRALIDRNRTKLLNVATTPIRRTHI
jgi:hypothetical protein